MQASRVPQTNIKRAPAHLVQDWAIHVLRDIRQGASAKAWRPVLTGRVPREAAWHAHIRTLVPFWQPRRWRLSEAQQQVVHTACAHTVSLWWVHAFQRALVQAPRSLLSQPSAGAAPQHASCRIQAQGGVEVPAVVGQACENCQGALLVDHVPRAWRLAGGSATNSFTRGNADQILHARIGRLADVSNGVTGASTATPPGRTDRNLDGGSRTSEGSIITPACASTKHIGPSVPLQAGS